MLKKMNVKTNKRVELIDITSKIKQQFNKMKIESGILVVSVPHTTAAVTINENADPDVKKDIVKELNQVIPFDDNYKHREGNSAAHIKSSLIGSSETVIIDKGKLLLGRWQGIYFCEFDGPRRRNLYLKVVKD